MTDESAIPKTSPGRANVDPLSRFPEGKPGGFAPTLAKPASAPPKEGLPLV